MLVDIRNIEAIACPDCRKPAVQIKSELRTFNIIICPCVGDEVRMRSGSNLVVSKVKADDAAARSAASFDMCPGCDVCLSASRSGTELPTSSLPEPANPDSMLSSVVQDANSSFEDCAECGHGSGAHRGSLDEPELPRCFRRGCNCTGYVLPKEAK